MITLFPHPESAGKDGLLAMGGDLDPYSLLLAYRFGIFPWYNEGDPILWWSPDPRCVLYPQEVKIPKSMHRCFKKQIFQLKFDHDFETVIKMCKQIKRKGQGGTWITDDMEHAYNLLFDLNYAHSVEVYQNDQLVGGLYGLSIGDIFYGESMFSMVSNASKYALISLCLYLRKKEFRIIDCQQVTNHLLFMGAVEMPRQRFMQLLRQNLFSGRKPQKWHIQEEEMIHLFNKR